MMRPACAYPSVLQPGLQNGPDMYSERDVYNFGILNNQPPSSVQTMSSNPSLYSLPLPGQSGPGGLLGSVGTQSFHPHSTSFSLPSYSQIPMQPAYSAQLPPDLISSGHAPPLSTQHPPQQYSTVINPSSDKLMPQNSRPTGPTAGYNRLSGLPNGPISVHPNMSMASPSYGGGGGVLSTAASNPTTPLSQQHVPTSNNILSGNDNRSISQSQMACRSAGSRVASDVGGLPGQPMYASYSSGVSVAQPIAASASGVGNVQVPYSIAIFTSTLPVTMSSMVNKANISSTVSYCSNPSIAPQGTPGSGSQCRPPCSTLTLGMQQPSIYVPQQPRLQSQPANFAHTGYISQQYPPSSVQFRPGTALVPGNISTVPMMSRPQNTSSPLMGKDVPGSNCLTMHPGMLQQPTQSTQMPACSSATSSGSPNSCSAFPSSNTCKGFRNNTGSTTGHMFTTVPGCGIPPNMVGSGTSVTPPGSILLNGPTQPMGQPSLIGHVNGCVPLGSENEMKILRGDFDGLSSNPSSMMMMTMPVSSPIPGGTLISNGLPTGMMNVAMVNQAPAPPPYHQPNSLINCRSLGPSSFYGPPGMSSVPVTGGVHNNSASSMAPLPDGCGMISGGSMSAEHHFLSMPGESVSINETGLKQSQSGSLKGTTRAKRTRANKATPGTGRVSKANSKKNAAAVAAAAAATVSVTPPSNPLQSTPNSDPYAMSNVRLSSQQPQGHSVRQKVLGPGWNVCPSNLINTFPSGLASPPLSMSVCDGRTGSVSPASFTSSNGIVMRPNSGPPVNSAYNTTSHGTAQMMSTGPTDNAGRVLSSPRLFCSVSNQQQQQQPYLSSSITTTTQMPNGSFFVTHPHQPQPSCPPSGTSPVPVSLGQQHPNHPGCGHGPSMRFVQSPMHFPTQHPGLTPSGFVAASRATPQVRTSTPVGSSGAVPNEPNCPTDRLSRQPCSGLGSTVGTSSSEMSSACSTVDTDRLVCPITNGMVWGPTQIQLNEVLHKFLPDGVFVLRFEFDLTANHLNTIVGRSDLDIVVCSHLISEPLQVCHWPSDAVQIRFNEYLLRLDRSTVNGGQSAHKVACVKQLCRPGRNQLEIAILGLGEDPNHLSTMNKRHSMAAILETHRFAAFMAHMPALNVLLDGLKRRRPAGVSVLCDILEGRVRQSETGAHNFQPRTTPVVAELNLVCPVFRTRMNVPGRITGCEHVEAFDMEAFLRREVLWPRLNCPICGHKSPAGLDGLCIDTTIMNAIRLVHPAIESILVRSDGFWRLPPPICLDLPLDFDQWQPLIGPLTEIVTNALNSMAVIRTCEQRPSASVSSSNQPTPDSVGPGALRNQYQPTTSSTNHIKTVSASTAQITPVKETASPWTTDIPNSPAVPDKNPNSLSDFAWSDNKFGCKVSKECEPISQPNDWPSGQISPTESTITTSSQGSKLPADRKGAHCLPPDYKTISQTSSCSSHSKHESSTDQLDTLSNVGQTDNWGTHSVSCFPDRSTTSVVQSSRIGWSDPIACATSADSPGCFGSATLRSSSSSLPASPSLGQRCTSASTLTIPLVSALGTNATERASSSTNCTLPSLNLHPSGTMGSGHTTLGMTKCVPSFDVQTSSPNSSSTTATSMPSTSSHFASEERSACISWSSSASCSHRLLTSETTADTIDTSIAQASAEYGYNKKQTSSLNMGLDFLLAEEQSMTDHISVRNFHEHSLSPRTSAVGTSVGNCSSSAEPVVVFSNDTFHSVDSKSVKRGFSTSLRSDPASNQNATTSYGGGYESVVQPDNDLDTHTVESTSSSSLSNTGTKRIKVDPDCQSLASSNETKVDGGYVSSNPASDEGFDPSKLKVEPKSWGDENYDFWTSSSPHQHSPCLSDIKVADGRQDSTYHNDTRAHNSFSLFSTPWDEHLCVDSIHSLSSQIDRIEIFLDESYIRFVQSFACT